ncbi:MAG: hypothetical protein JO303_05580 [Caulobacteraceae bacterium]|nr:hypothetical protein [Caulobacteraceae bacterium]
MSDPKIFPPRSPDRRQGDRRKGVADRRSGAEGKNLPVPISPPDSVRFEQVGEPKGKAVVMRRSAVAAYAAQMLGQDGQKRGLRGGKETLDKARTSYLGTEWSGSADRRPPAGRITKTEI